MNISETGINNVDAYQEIIQILKDVSFIVSNENKNFVDRREIFMHKTE